MSTSFQKKKKFKEQLKKYFVNFFIFLLIFAFASTLGIYWGTNNNTKISKIAKINNTVYTYQPGSAFSYLQKWEGDAYERQAGFRLPESEIISLSVNDLVSSAILSDFGNKIGLIPSRAVIGSYIQKIIQGSSITPDPGLIEAVKLEFYRNAFNNSFADIDNALAPASLPEIYNFYDLMNYKASAEFIYLNATNFIKSKLTDTDLAAFYQKNISNYVSEITVEDMAISNNKTAYAISYYINKNSWAAAIDNFRTNYTYSADVILKSTNGTAKRFAKSIGLTTGSVFSVPQFENGVYHIDRIKSMASIDMLDSDVKDQLLSDFVSANYPVLRARFDADIKSAVSKAEDMTKASVDLQKVSAASGMTYAKSVKISPISQTIPDLKDSPIPIPLSGLSGMQDFIFTAAVNSASPTFTTGDIFVIVKPLTRASSSTNLNAISQEVLYSYFYFKSSSIQKDWYQNLKNRYQVTIDDKGTNDLLKQLQ